MHLYSAPWTYSRVGGYWLPMECPLNSWALTKPTTRPPKRRSRQVEWLNVRSARMYFHLRYRLGSYASLERIPRVIRLEPASLCRQYHAPDQYLRLSTDLRINVSKIMSELIPGDQRQSILLDGEPSEGVSKFKYLGSLIDTKALGRFILVRWLNKETSKPHSTMVARKYCFPTRGEKRIDMAKDRCSCLKVALEVAH